MSDTVTVVVKRAEPLKCRYRLSVSPAAKSEVPIQQPGTESGSVAPATWDELRLPDVNALVRLPGRDGLLVGVTTWTGSSTVFAGLFAFVDGKLSRIHISGAPMPDALSYGGSALTPTAVDCQGGRVVFSSANQERGKWRVSRRSYDLIGDALVEHAPPEISFHPSLTPDFGGAGGEGAFFKSCAVARSNRSF